MGIKLKEPHKYRFLERFCLEHGESLIPWLSMLAGFSNLIGVVLLTSPGGRFQKYLGIFALCVGCFSILCIGVIQVVYLQLRRREHQSLIGYVEGLRKYTVSGLTSLNSDLEKLSAPTPEEPPPVEVPSADFVEADRALGTRERNTLLALIGVLCKEAQIDYSKPAAAAAALGHAADLLGVRLPESTIEEKLKLVPDAIAARSR